MSQQSEDDPSSTSPLLFSTPPNEIYFGETTIEEGGEGIEKIISTEEKIISETKINFVDEPMKRVNAEEGSHKGEGGLERQPDAFGTSLNQQNSLEDKFKSFSMEENEEENVGELNEDMDFKEEKRENHKISQEKNDSSAAKININNNEILVSSQMMDDKPCASSVIFFSPNNNTKMEEILMEQGEDSEKQGEDSEAKLDLPEDLSTKNNREEEHEDPEPLQSFSNKNSNLLGTTPTTSSISCIKMSASIADLLPSRFPIEENEQNKNNKKESKLEGLAAKTAKMVYSATFNNTFPSCEGEGSMGKEDMKIKKLNQKPLEGDITNKNNSNIPTTKVNTTNRRTSLSKIFTNFRLQLEKTKTAFLTTSSSTDELKKPLNKRKNLNNIPITRSFTTSLASPSTSSSSLDNYLRRRRENKNKGGGGGSFLKKKCVEEKMDKQQQQYYTTTEDFTASNSEQLTILSGQRVEILNNCDIGEDNNNNNEFVKIAVLDKVGQRENEGMVPKRILMPLESPGGS